MLTILTRRSFTAGFSTLALALGNTAAADGQLLFSIPAGFAPLTLNEWVYQSGLQLMDDYPTVAPWRTHGIAGTWRPLEALDLMLRDTPLIYRILNARTVVVTLGTRYCEPWLSPSLAPLPPCVQMPSARQGGRL